ncbi:sensor histidine kinase [Microbacterium wangchenii]|uniref:sensor histidine kinase n=1 Tax=Microbacterium wangchenii TaxID=2541726 RepID=UPI00164F7F02|nr:histidine kinase [Microbacterium wangchenii]
MASNSWPTWSWVGAAIIGSLPVLCRPRWALIFATAVSVTGVALALVAGHPLLPSLVIIFAVGGGLACLNWTPVWLWRLIADADAGRRAEAVLVSAEERLRFARDVHDHIGHRLSVIALKAELLARSAHHEPDTVRGEGREIQRLALMALDDVRVAVSGSRAVDLDSEMKALSQILSASGVRCSLTVQAQAKPSEAAVLAPIAREAVTNVLRHSRAAYCELRLEEAEGGLGLTVENDGAIGGGDDKSAGLAGIRDRLAEVGGSLVLDRQGDVFTLRATVRGMR